jgi:hypothetical protein
LAGRFDVTVTRAERLRYASGAVIVDRDAVDGT